MKYAVHDGSDVYRFLACLLYLTIFLQNRNRLWKCLTLYFSVSDKKR